MGDNRGNAYWSGVDGYFLGFDIFTLILDQQKRNSARCYRNPPPETLPPGPRKEVRDETA